MSVDLPPPVLVLDCRAAAAEAERHAALPSGLLGAIAMVESSSNPLAIRVDGPSVRQPRSFGDAVELVRVLASSGRAADVGCFQINLGWHSGSFAGPSSILDPVAQAHFAARWLLLLKVRHGTWTKAVAHYHGASDETLRTRYVCRVAQAWKSSRYVEPTSCE